MSQPEQTIAGPADTDAGGRRNLSAALAGRAFDLVLRLGGLTIAIIVVAVVFRLLEPSYLSTEVVLSTLRSMSSLAIMALGLTLVIIVGEIDLSFAATFGLAANLLAAMWILHDWALFPALLVALLACVVVGAINGLLVAFVKVPSFIVTLGSYNLIYGLSLYFGKSQTMSPAYPPNGHHVGSGELSFFTDLTKKIGSSGFSIEILWMVAIALVVGFLLHRTIFGFRLMAIGGNPEAARLARLPVRKYKVLAFVLAAVLAGIAGILDFSFSGSVAPNAGLENTFPVFAAVIIGGASLSGGRGTVIGTMGGALLLAALSTGLALVASGPFAQQMFLGGVTIGAVLLDIWSRKAVAARAGRA
ncbi:MAG TPA: ABC transporter permease [Solirubrobacterales bacterium]|nr:ABC transporter permease [Solirubrobacterales bacterium]